MRYINTAIYAAALAAISLAAAGCTLDVHTHRDRYEERPVVVEHRYEYHPDRVVVVDAPPRGYTTVVREAPPPSYAEVIPPPPDREVIWISGYWVVNDNRWVWVHGHYERPPRRGVHWEAHTWVRHGDSFELRVGGWH